MKSFPKLFKKTSTGATQMWEISVFYPTNYTGKPEWTIKTEYGQVDGKIQTTEDQIKEGKNIGKVNETSAEAQAEAEAQAKWEKQKKKGYVESVESAVAGEVDSLIEGGVNPMLAQSYSKHPTKIKFPCFVQPKLDGHRCVAIIKDGKCTLWSRTRKQIHSVPHIVAELEAMYAEVGNGVLDGELYNHDYRTKFEELTSLIRKDEPAPGHEAVQYHVYDMIHQDAVFADRWSEIETIFAMCVDNKYVHIVTTVGCENEEAITGLFSEATAAGYEGIMLRNGDGPYLGKRSYDLQKVKEFLDAEFKIIDLEEGRGKLAGHVGAFVCEMSDGKRFSVKMSGDTTRLREFFVDPSLCLGKPLTVQYQGLTGTNGVPRFPVGLRIREDV